MKGDWGDEIMEASIANTATETDSSEYDNEVMEETAVSFHSETKFLLLEAKRYIFWWATVLDTFIVFHCVQYMV